MKSFNYADQGASRYVVGAVERFDQKNEMFKRPYWDPDQFHLQYEFARKQINHSPKKMYGLHDKSLSTASWLIEDNFAKGILGGRFGLYSWEPENEIDTTKSNSPLITTAADLKKTTQHVKNAARFLGASMVGVCKLDRRWLYSNAYNLYEDGLEPIHKIEIHENYKYVIVIAVEMDYRAIESSPAYPASAATGLGYSKMAIIAGMLAEYIRGIGFNAIPSGNDTACSIPIAIDAGLGELARNGLLITPQFGPRVRLAKVFTDLPLVPDRPIEFGVWDFCLICEKCARNCPSKSIKFGEPTEKPNNLSNRRGVLRWPINAETCLSFWRSKGNDCSNCIRSCPFNKPAGLIHDYVRWGINNLRWLDKLFLWGDELLGYGKRKHVR